MRHNPTMPKYRTIPLMAFLVSLPVWVSAQGPAPGPESPLLKPGATAEPVAPPTEAEKVIDEAIKKIEARESVAADIRMDAEMLGESFRVVGQYLKAPGYRMLMKLDVEELGDSSGTILQVCDGTTLWDYSKVLDAQSLRKLTIAPILKPLEQPELDAQIRDQIRNQLGFAGPETLLSGLRKTIAFDQKDAGTLDGKPVWILRGVWKDRDSLGLPGPQNAPGFFPAYVPSVVTVWLGQEDGWPYKIKLEGKVPSVVRDNRMLGPDGRPIGRKSLVANEKPTSITLLYRLEDRAVGPRDFLFQPPPGVKVQDDTERFAAELETTISNLAARKRNEAASGPLIDEPVTAPRPEPAEPPAPAPSPEKFRSTAPPPS